MPARILILIHFIEPAYALVHLIWDLIIVPFFHFHIPNQYTLLTLVSSETKKNQASLRWTAQWSQTNEFYILSGPSKVEIV